MLKYDNFEQDELSLYDRKDVCTLLKIGISHLDKIPESELPRVHLGKSIRFKRKSLLNYINNKEYKNDKPKK